MAEMTGFVTDGYIDKHGLTDSEAMNPNTRYNVMPPGQNITNQPNALHPEIPFKQVTAEGFPGDGWSGSSDPC